MLILTSSTLLGQNTSNNCIDPKYPITKVVDNDTVVLFSLDQEKCIYQWLEQKEKNETDVRFYEVLTYHMQSYTDSLENKVNTANDLIRLYNDKSINDEKIIVNLIEQVRLEKNLQNIYKKEISSVKRKKNKVLVIGGIIVTGLTTGLIISILN